MVKYLLRSKSIKGQDIRPLRSSVGSQRNVTTKQAIRTDTSQVIKNQHVVKKIKTAARKLKPCCLICLDGTGEAVMTCPSAHVVCWPCTSTYVTSISDFENNTMHTRALNARGELKCPNIDCQQPFKPRHGYAQVPPQFATLLHDLQRAYKRHVKHVEAERLRILDEKLNKYKKALLPALDTIADEDEALDIIRQYIREEILCIRCPKCLHVFADYEGCDYVTCEYPGCGANFCGLCLAFRGPHEDDDDDHECPFYDESDIDPEEAWSIERERKVIEYASVNLRNKSASFKERLTHLMKQDFADLDFVIVF